MNIPASFATHFFQELQSNKLLSNRIDEVQYCKRSPPNKKDKANQKRKEVNKLKLIITDL
jgi:hypothetical protein